MDCQLSNLDSSQEDLVEALCAFCLATSSSSADAVRHYHHLRLREIRRVPELAETGQHNAVHALRYYIRSLQTTKAILGRPLSEALRILKVRPILRDSAVQQLDELDLETLQRWVATEIQDFIPFIKHNDMTKSEIESVTSSWSRDAFSSLVDMLRDELEGLNKTVDLLSLRSALLETWLPVCTSTPVHSSSDVLESLRELLNQRVNQLIGIEADALTTIGAVVASTVNVVAEPEGSVASVWDATFVTMQTGKGASAFKRHLRARHLGTTDQISSGLRSLESWISQVKTTESVAQLLVKDRWQDKVEEDGTDDDAPAVIEHMLTVKDSELYKAAQREAIVTATSKFQINIRDASDLISDVQGTTKVPTLLRIIREICQRLRRAFPALNLTTLDDMVPGLHEQLANDVATRVVALFKSRPASNCYTQRTLNQLWDGTPPLPTQPSPRVFKLLYKLSGAMAERGTDLWTPSAVVALKQAVSKRLVESELLEPRDVKKLNGFSNGVALDEAPAAVYIQSLFDVLYLDCILRTPDKAEEPTWQLTATIKRLELCAELGDLTQVIILEKRAKEYCTRTSLLFGLLV